ncbi:MAG: DUF6152 family protein [Vicinamibacterales bacterium]
MRFRFSLGLTWALVVLAGLSPAAHHSFSAGFDLSHKFTVTGTLTKIDWRNPHIQLFVDVKNAQGQPEAWVIESMPPSFFRDRSVGSRADLDNAIGKTLTIEGVRARDGSPSGIAEKITLPDGRSATVFEAQIQ